MPVYKTCKLRKIALLVSVGDVGCLVVRDRWMNR